MGMALALLLHESLASAPFLACLWPMVLVVDAQLDYQLEYHRRVAQFSHLLLWLTNSLACNDRYAGVWYQYAVPVGRIRGRQYLPELTSVPPDVWACWPAWVRSPGAHYLLWAGCPQDCGSARLFGPPADWPLTPLPDTLPEVGFWADTPHWVWESLNSTTNTHSAFSTRQSVLSVYSFTPSNDFFVQAPIWPAIKEPVTAITPGPGRFIFPTHEHQPPSLQGAAATRKLSGGRANSQRPGVPLCSPLLLTP